MKVVPERNSKTQKINSEEDGLAHRRVPPGSGIRQAIMAHEQQPPLAEGEEVQHVQEGCTLVIDNR